MSWERVDLSSPQFEKPTEPPAICGLIYRGKRHGLSGPPETAKTLAALIFGLEQLRSGGGAFAVLDFEMGEHATRLLLHELGASLEEIASVYYVTPIGPPEPADLDALTAAGVTLAVVDTLAGAFDVSGLDDNWRADAERFSRLWITPLWRLGITTLTLDHVVKNSEARGKYAIGSERKLGTVDVHLGLEAVRQLHRGASGLVKITTHKDRPGHLPRPRAAELELHSDPDTHRITWAFNPASEDSGNRATDWRPTYLMDRVTDYLRQLSEPVSRKTITDHVNGKRSYLLQAIDALIEDGAATETPGAHGAKLITLAQRPVPVPDLFPEHLGTTKGNVLFPVPLSTEGTRRGNK